MKWWTQNSRWVIPGSKQGAGVGKVHTGNFNRIDCVWFTVSVIGSLMFILLLRLVTYKYIAYILLWYQILPNKILIKPHKIGFIQMAVLPAPSFLSALFCTAKLNEGHRPERRKKCVEDDIYIYIQMLTHHSSELMNFPGWMLQNCYKVTEPILYYSVGLYFNMVAHFSVEVLSLKYPVQKWM